MPKVSVATRSTLLRKEQNGVEFVVSDEDGKMGELVVSRGGLRWKSKNQRDHRFISWKKFNQIVENGDFKVK